MSENPSERDKQPKGLRGVEVPSTSSGRRLAFEVRVSWVLLGAVLIGFGPVAALAVVASIKNADALATVALALAIVAFAIQILVFIVQTQSASQQMLQSERLNTQTRELLVEVRTAVASTQTMVGDQFRDLLRAFVEGASKTAAETGKFDPEQFERRLINNIQEATQRAAQAEQRTTGTSRQKPDVAQRRARSKRVAEKQREVALLSEFPPEEEGEQIAVQMRDLSDSARRRLQELGNDEVTSREAGVYVGLADNDEADEDLASLSLLAHGRVRVEDGVMEVKRLTDKGRQWASLLVATGDIPSYAAGLVPPPPPSEDDIPF